MTATSSESAILPIGLAVLGKSSPQLPKSDELLRRQDLPDGELTFKSETCKFALCRPKLAQARLKVCIGNRIGIDGHIESAVSFSQPMLGTHHQRSTLLIYATDLLKLFRRQPELRKQIRTTIYRVFGPVNIFRRRFVLCISDAR